MLYHTKINADDLINLINDTQIHLFSDTDHLIKQSIFKSTQKNRPIKYTDNTNYAILNTEYMQNDNKQTPSKKLKT